MPRRLPLAEKAESAKEWDALVDQLFDLDAEHPDLGVIELARGEKDFAAWDALVDDLFDLDAEHPDFGFIESEEEPVSLMKETASGETWSEVATRAWDTRGRKGEPATVFHGTTKERLATILKEGLKASRAGETYPDFAKKGHTYFTTDEDKAKDWALAAAQRALNNYKTERVDGQADVAVLTLRIPDDAKARAAWDRNFPRPRGEQDDLAREAGVKDIDRHEAYEDPDEDYKNFQFAGDIPPEWIVKTEVATIDTRMSGYDVQRQPWKPFKLRMSRTVYVALILDVRPESELDLAVHLMKETKSGESWSDVAKRAWDTRGRSEHKVPQPKPDVIENIKKNHVHGWKRWVETFHSKMTPEQYVEKVTEKVRALAKDAKPFIRVQEDILERVLDDGRFRSQHETFTSNGSLMPEYRMKTERSIFGDGYECPTDCPIYGHLANPDKALDWAWSTANTYGNIAVELHERPDRTSVFFGDSLSDIDENSKSIPRPLTELDSLAIQPQYAPLDLYERDTDTKIRYLRRDPLEWATLEEAGNKAGLFYVEAQYHGGVTVKDIKQVIFPARNYTGSLDDENFRKNYPIVDRLDKAGIPWKVMDDDRVVRESGKPGRLPSKWDEEADMRAKIKREGPTKRVGSA